MFSIILLFLLSTSLVYAVPADIMNRDDETLACPESATDILMGGKILKFQVDRKKKPLLAFEADLASIIKTSTEPIPKNGISDEDIKKARDTKKSARKYWVGRNELEPYYTYKDFLRKPEAVASWEKKGCKDWELHLLQAFARTMYGNVAMLKPTWRSYPPATPAQKERLQQLENIVRQEFADPAGLVCMITWIGPNMNVENFRKKGLCRGGINDRDYPYFPPKNKESCPTSADDFKGYIGAPKSKNEFILKDPGSERLSGLKDGHETVSVDDLIDKDFVRRHEYLDPTTGKHRLFCPWFWALATQAAARVATGAVNIVETTMSPKIPSLGMSQTMPKAPSIFELLTFYELRKRHEVTSVFLTTVSNGYTASPVEVEARVALQGNWRDGKASRKKSAPE